MTWEPGPDDNEIAAELKKISNKIGKLVAKSLNWYTAETTKSLLDAQIAVDQAIETYKHI